VAPDAGPGAIAFTLDGVKGLVNLDGRGSYDPEGSPLVYQWFLDDELVSRESRFSIDLPVGEHRLKLVVRERSGLSAVDETTAVVMDVLTAEMMVSPITLARHGGDGAVTAVMVLPGDIMPEDVDRTRSMLMFPGALTAEYEKPPQRLNGKTLMLARFRRSDLLEAVPEDGPLDLWVIGRLRDGHYFSATDTVTIK
jgi:hypothetical protein